MIGISSYGGMMNHSSNSYYRNAENIAQASNNKNNNPMKTIYDTFDQKLTDNRNQKIDQGLEKMFTRLKTKESNAEKANQAMQDAQKLSSSLTDKMDALKTSADQLKNTSFSSVLKPLSYGSQNESVASVVSGAAKNNAAITLKVDQLAAKQMTNFKAMDSTAKDALSGQSTMQLTMNGKSQTLNFNIAEGATTKDALKAISTVINDAKAGVTASVTEVDGKSILSVMSNQTGKNQSFQMDFTGKLKDAMKVQSTIDARDAMFAVNGTTETSATNQVKIPTNGTDLTVNLKGTGETTLSKANMDTSKVVDSMNQFITAYNDAVNFLSENQTKSSGLAALSNSFSSRSFGASGLRAVGIEVDAKGRLSLNEGKFVDTLKNNPKQIEKTVGSYNGLAGTAASKAQSAMILSDSLVKNYSSASGMGTYNSSGQAVGFFYNMVV